MACLFLIRLTAMCALDVASSLRIVKVERAPSEADTNKFVVTVHYDQAEQERQAEWVVSQNRKDTVLQGVMKYSSEDKSGVASVDFDKTVNDAKFRLGRLGSHFMEFRLNLRGNRDETLTHDVNLALSTITPETDVTYKASDGQTTTVTVITPPVSSGSKIKIYMKELHPTGYVLDKTTVKVESTAESGLQYVQTEYTEDGQGTVTITFTFETDNNEMNGYYKAGFHYSYTKRNVPSPISYGVLEVIVLLVHEDSNQGPFPDDFVNVEMTEKTKNCLQQQYCCVKCQAFGNDIQSLLMYQVTAGGEEVDMGTEVEQDVGGYLWSAKVNLEGAPSGQCVCRVKQGDLVATDNMQLLQVEEQARADRPTYEMIDTTKVKVTCEGSGSQPLEVRLFWGDYVKPKEEFKEGVDGVVSYTPGQAQGDTKATAVLDTASVPTSTIVCKASNPASNGYSYLETAKFSS